MIRIQRLHPEARLPTRGTPQSVGLDLYALLLTDSGRPNKAIVPPRTTRAIPTGIAATVVDPHSDEGHPPARFFYLQVCSRSGLAKGSIFVTNAPGIVDPDYRGEILVLLYNGGHESYYVQHGDRIAQLIVAPAIMMPITEVHDLVTEKTSRGSAGWGSTGR